MASDELLDFERLLAPISPDEPCGENLRWDPLWDDITRLRKRQTDVLGAIEDVEPDSPAIVSSACTALADRSKDLMVACWLTESLIQTRGFAGLRDGLRLIYGLVESYWDQLYTQLDEDGDLEVRAAPLVWLADPDAGARMPSLVRGVPLAATDDGTVYSWTYWNARFAASMREGEDEDAFQRRRAEADTKKEKFDSAVSATPLQFYVDLNEDIEQCLSELDRLAVAADARLGDYAPGWSGLRQSIAEIQVLARSLLTGKGGLAPAADGAAAADAQHPGSNGSGQPSFTAGSVASGPIRSRAEAVARLQEVAEFFRNSDPHSPIAHLLRRAIRWSGMTFEDLMKELIKDHTTLGHVGETLGLAALSGETTESE